MATALTCDDCGRSYQVRPELAGRSVRCKSCGQMLVIPQSSVRPAAPAGTRAPARPSASAFDDEPPLNLPRAGYVARDEGPKLTPAPLTRRCLAFFFDRAAILAIAGAVALAAVPLSPDSEPSEEVRHHLVGALILGYVLAYIPYLTLFHAFVGGATPGKMLLRIRVVDQYGEPIGPWCALRRAFSQWLMRVTLFLWMKNIACLLSSPDTLTLYDETCGTAVILAD